MAYVRKVKTASGVTAVQIVSKATGKLKFLSIKSIGGHQKHSTNHS